MVNLIISSGNAVRRLVTGGAAALLATMLALPANAIEYSYGEVSGSIDTIVSLGASMRTSKRSCGSVSKANGGCQGVDASGIDHTFGGTTNNASTDDGNLNYDQWDVFSGALKATSEVLANYRNFNMFVRGTGFFDPMPDKTDFRDLGDPQKSEVERNAKLLDYFVGGSFDVGGRPVDIRLGNQVISWGESTFIQNGINVINPIDVAAVRKPGSEIKEFFIPVLAAKGSIGLPGNVSLEGFYQFKSDNIVPDPSGTFFSTTDAVGRGAQALKLGASDLGDDDGVFNAISHLRGIDLDGLFNPTFFGSSAAINAACLAPANAAALAACGGSAFVTALPAGREAFNGFATPVNQAYGARPLLANTSSATIERNNDRNADDGGEGGFALRYFSEELNQGTEFGLYVMNVHSRLPLLSVSRINAATGYSVGTPGFNLGQFSARGFADVDLDPGAGITLAAGPGATAAQAAAVNAQNAAATALGLGVAAHVGNGGLPGALTGFLAGVGTGAGNTAVDAFENGQFTCNVLVPTNHGAMIGHGVGSAAAAGLGTLAGANLALPGGYTNCNNSTRLRRGFSAQLDRVLLALPVQTMTFRLDYPEDIKLFGLSANTTIGPLAVQGEVAYKHDQPLQYALGEQVRAALDVLGGTAFVTGAASTVDVNGDGVITGADYINGTNHTVADLAANDGVFTPDGADADTIADNVERGRFDPLDAQVQRAVAALTSDYASAGVSTGACSAADPRCTFGDVGVIEGFASFTGTLSAAQLAALGGAAGFQCLGGPCADLAAVNASGGRTFNLAAAAVAAAAGTLAPGTVIGTTAITAAQAATWNELGRIILDPLAPTALGAASSPASPSVLSAMPNDIVFARHVDFASPAPAIAQGSVIDGNAFGSDGFIENPLEDVYTAQTTLTSLLYGSNPVVEFLNADSGVTVSEFGLVWLPGISTSDGISSSNTQGLANAAAGDVYKLNSTLIDPSNFATSFSWGAQGIFNFTYNRVFGSPINLVPGVAWKWDLGGRTPGPLGNYMAERKALGLNVGANYQNRWTGSLSWTHNFGPDAPLTDRDFAAATISYSF